MLLTSVLFKRQYSTHLTCRSWNPREGNPVHAKMTLLSLDAYGVGYMVAYLKGEKLFPARGMISGRKKITVANKLAPLERTFTKQEKLNSRNAYRLAIGLPAIKGKS